MCDVKYEIQVGASALEAACFLPSSPLPHSPLRQGDISRCLISRLLGVTYFCHGFFMVVFGIEKRGLLEMVGLPGTYFVILS